MRSLLTFLIVLLASSTALAQGAPLGSSVIASPSAFNIQSGKGSKVKVNYTFRVAASGRRTSMTSRSGSFLTGKGIAGTRNLLLVADIEKGYGEVTEVIEVPERVIDEVLKRGLKRFTYTRVFTGRQGSLTASVEFNIMVTGLTVRSIELYFEGRKGEATIQRNHPLLKAYADIRLEGTGLLQGYWEVDGKVLSRVNQPLTNVRDITIETPDIPPIPTSEPGMHRVGFVVTKPDTRLALPSITYFVLPEGLDGIHEYVPGQIIVALKEEDFVKGYADRLREKYGLEILDDYNLVSIGLRAVLFEARENDILRIIDAIRKERIALVVQPNHIFRTMGGDPLSERQYGNAVLKIGDIHARYMGRGAKVAVLDTGVDTEHEDLKERIVMFKNFVRGNDYRAEIHGTAVAGIISSAINGVGIEGVAPEAELVALRACMQVSMRKAIGDCFTDSLARALDAAIVNRVNIVNMSFGGEKDGLLARLMDKGIEKGIIFVAPVGNEVTQKDLPFPASHPGVVAVGGLDERMQPYPNPEVVRETSVNAPAVNILTTFPHNRYNFITGTSLSSAYISGLIALAIEKDGSINRKGLPVYSGTICRWEERLLGMSLCNRR